MKNISLALVVFSIAVVGCSSSPELTSRLRNSDEASWQDSTMYIKDQNMAVGVQNDREYFYLTLEVGDRMKQRQILFRGITVWLDYNGGEERRFGIHYPIGMERPMFGERRQDSEGRSENERMHDTSMIFPEHLSDELEIIGPMNGEHHRLHMAETKGIAINIKNNNGTLLYELKVPLMDNGPHLYGIGARAGTTIGLGIETGGFMQGGRGEGPGLGGGQGRDMGGGRRGGFGGGRGGSGAPPGGFRSQSDPIKFWMKVKLAGG